MSGHWENEMKKNYLSADCDPAEVETIRRNLFYEDTGFETYSKVSNWKRTGLSSEIKRYLSYFGVGWKMFKSRSEVGALIGWQQFHALIFVFFCSIFNVNKTTKVIALNFTYKKKKKFTRIYKWFMKKCINPLYLDYIHVLSNNYADVIHNQFDYPRNRIIVTPFGVDDCFEEFSKLEPPKRYAKSSYALALGRSNRDFQFLIDCWENVDFPLVIISDTFAGNTNNKNITIKRDVAGEDSYPWIANCFMMIIPIDNPVICSGDTVLLNAMACQKNVVVTAPSTLAEMYISNGVNGYTVKKEKAVFSREINKILKSNDTVAKRAREDFLERFSREQFGKRISNVLNGDNLFK